MSHNLGVIDQPRDGAVIVIDGKATQDFFLLLDQIVATLNDRIAESETVHLEDIADDINTSADKVLGFPVRNIDTGVLVFASGNTDGAVWHYYDETTAHTPV